MPFKKVLVAACVMLLMGALLRAQADKAEPSGAQMAKSAQTFLGSLSEEQKAQATFEFDSPERINWHFIPRERKGLPLKQMEGETLRNAHALIQSGLSKSGYEQTLNVMSLEEVLYLLESGDRETRRKRRDPQNYYLTIFGKPGNSGLWGWRLEGHHLSLNYTIKDGEVVSSTPEFFGANPAFIDAGPKRSIRVLAPEEDIARQILKLASSDRQETIWISKEAPNDVRGGGAPQPETSAPVGLKAGEMNADQKEMLGKLLDEYLKNMPADVESRRRSELKEAGLDNIYFAWWGSSERNERHAYRVQGPTFIIEYNNTQNDANHIHSMWRDLKGDFHIPLAKSE